MRINRNAKELKAGDKITTDFFSGEEKVVRTIIWIKDNPKMGSGREVFFDSGGFCPYCSKPLGTSLEKYPLIYDGIDASWAILANKDG
jgi:hypothetical protein